MGAIIENKKVYFRNSGTMPNDKIQNKFTAYLHCAIRKRRNKYLNQKIRYENTMFPICNYHACCEKSSIEYENLRWIVFSLSKREQVILHEYVVMRRTHLEIATRLSMTLCAVQKAYQRLIVKLRKEMDV